MPPAGAAAALLGAWRPLAAPSEVLPTRYGAKPATARSESFAGACVCATGEERAQMLPTTLVARTTPGRRAFAWPGSARFITVSENLASAVMLTVCMPSQWHACAVVAQGSQTGGLGV